MATRNKPLPWNNQSSVPNFKTQFNTLNLNHNNEYLSSCGSVRSKSISRQTKSINYGKKKENAVLGKFFLQKILQNH